VTIQHEYHRIGLWYLDCHAGDVHHDKHRTLTFDADDLPTKFMVNKAREPHMEFLGLKTIRVV
jgi:hypothetical protein